MTARKKLANKRPTLHAAITWIAENDNSGQGDSLLDIASYISTCFAADLFGCCQYDLAIRIGATRERLGLQVRNLTVTESHEFAAMRR